MREHFSREEDNTLVMIEVEPNAYGYSQKLQWLLSLFIKFDASDETAENYEQFLDTKESLIQFLEHDENSKYVGSRVVDGWSELYFYTRDSKNFTKRSASFFQEFEYPYETNIVKDAKWSFYTNHLYPTQTEWFMIQSQKIIEMLQEEGDDTTQPHQVEHYVYFDTPTQKERFVAKLPLEGFEYKDEISSEEFDNGIALMKTHSVTPEVVQQEILKLLDFLQAENGYYELWSTTLVSEVGVDG